MKDAREGSREGEGYMIKLMGPFSVYLKRF
jgi:hypothetical protein